MRSLGWMALLSWAPAPAVFGFVLFFAAGTTAYLGWGVIGPPPPQPIAFNHSKHVENGIACTDCHTGAEGGQRATLPGLDTCLTCHQSALTQSAEEAKLIAAAGSGKPLEWRQITRMPPHVYFPHRRHVQVAKISCETCHGPVEKATVPVSRPFRRLDMDDCMGCHEKNWVKSDCNDCHR